jgi:hypothetical protein
MDIWKSAIGQFAALSDTTYLQTIDAAGDIQLLNVRIDYTASSTVGDRALILQVLNRAFDIVIAIPLSTDLAIIASDTKVIQMSIGIASYDAWVDDFAVVTLPSGLIIPGDHYLRIDDIDAVSTDDAYALDINFASRQKGALEKVTPA